MSNSSKKIAIFPAAGSLGTSVYTHLAKLIPANRLVLVSRKPENIPKALTDAGTETRHADYNKTETFANAFIGVSYLFLISYPSIEVEHRLESHQAAVSAAIKSNDQLEHIFYTSLGFAGKDSTTSAAVVMQAHLRTEIWLRSVVAAHKSLTFTAIRQGIYSETWPMYTAFFEPSDQTDEIAIPHDGKSPGIAWLTIDNLGEANARLVQAFIAHPQQKYINKTVLLSGPKAWALNDVAEVLSRVAGRSITIRQSSIEEYAGNAKVIKSLESYGSEVVVRQWATVYEAIRDGETAVVADEVETLLGRPAEDFEVTVRRMLQQEVQ